MKARTAVGFAIAAAIAFSAAGAEAASQSCPAAKDYADKHGDTANETALRQILASCPNYARALNNLAVLMENQEKYDEAEALYRRAIAADESAVAPYAGLGDVLVAKENYASAVAAYETFLTRVASAKSLGRGQSFKDFENVYRSRLRMARGELGGGSAAASGRESTGVVAAATITRSLTRKPAKTRGLSLLHRTEPHIDLKIGFDFDSARLTDAARRQVDEISRALKSTALRDRRILIEGHTDNNGDQAYNHGLSERRAATVRQALVARGIPNDRLQAKGFGETRPVARNDSEAGQARNRRVTFVNVGRR